MARKSSIIESRATIRRLYALDGVYSRILKLVYFIAMDSINIIGNFYNRCKEGYSPYTFDELSRIYKEVDQIKRTESGLFRKILIIDLMSNKPKYGEIILAMQTIIALKCLGYKVKVYIYKKREIEGHVFEELMKIDSVMTDAYNDTEELAKILLIKSGIPCKIIEDKELQMEILRTKKDEILFADTVGLAHYMTLKRKYLPKNRPKSRNFWNLNQELLSLLFAQYKWEFSKINSSYLAGDILKEHAKPGKLISNKLVATNFRYNPARNKKDSIFSQIKKQADHFYDKYGYKTLVLTSKEGYESLEANSRESESIVFGKPGNFIEESKLLMNAKYFYQIQGGGIATWPILSSMPFTIISNPGSLFEYSEKALVAINSKNQILLVSPNYDVNHYWKTAKKVAKEVLSE